MDKAIIIHNLNSLDTQFKSYLAILSHDLRKKKQFPSLETLSKALKNEEFQLSNQDKTTANYARKEKKSSTSASATQTASIGRNSEKNKKSRDNSTTLTNKETYQCTQC